MSEARADHVGRPLGWRTRWARPQVIAATSKDMSASICFVVLTHNRASQVERLVECIYPNTALVHVDARASRAVSESFRQLPERLPNVELLPRNRSGWASWGLVQAALSGFRTAALHPDRYSHIVIMSGQDYPIQPVEEIARYFAGRPERSWMSREPLPAKWIGDPDGGLSRVHGWHVPVRGRRARLPLFRRPMPAGMAPFYGQAQCVVSMPLALWILAEVDRRPEIIRFFRHTWIPDELFFPSMAMASPYAGEVVNANLWYSDWSAGGAHPRTFGLGDMDHLQAVAKGEVADLSGGQLKFFARKFDMDGTAALDRQLAGQRGQASGAPVQEHREAG